MNKNSVPEHHCAGNSDDLFRVLFENSINAVAIHELIVDEHGVPVDYVFLQANRAFEKHTGLLIPDILGRRVTEVLPGIEKTHLIATYGNVAITGEPVQFEQFFEPLKRLYNISAFQVGTNRFATVFEDITERKEAEALLIKSHDYLGKIINSIADPVFVKDRDHCWVLLNDAYCSFMGYQRHELLGKSDVDFFPDHEAKEFWEKDELVFHSGGENINEEVFTDARGFMHMIVTKKTLITDPLGKQYIVGIIRDLTEHKKAEEKIKSLLAEKELLLREVHHRIKNNMNTMMNLLTLQSTALEDQAAISALKEARGRLQSMGVLYDKLYRSENVKELSLATYLPPLIDEIAALFPHKEQVTIEADIGDFILPVKTLAPLGLIINELLTNALKYAFTGSSSGIVKVTASRKDNRVTLVVEDNGKGMPESIDIGQTTGFGLQLVAIVAKQLKGTIRLERVEGSRFVLEFDA